MSLSETWSTPARTGKGGPGAKDARRADPERHATDRRLMRRALELAVRGWGRVAPNPLVGSVVVRRGRIVGEGHHAEFGGDHGEVVALRAARDEARGATLYVTLEPCAHHGKTPPCVDAILEAGVERVVVAALDPDPVAGGGAEALRRAGLEVEVGVEESAALSLNAPFLWTRRRDTPFTALKLALSLDARIAAEPGRRSAISGPEAWDEVHRLRAGFDAVAVGRRTATVDDPRLTARGAIEPLRPPVRVVLDPSLRLGAGSRLARSAGEAPTWVVEAPGQGTEERRKALEACGVRVVRGAAGEGGWLDLGRVWGILGREGLGSVLVEGGGRVAASLLEAGLVQRLYLIFAPILLGSGAVEAFPGLALDSSRSWRLVERRALGTDTMLILERNDVRGVLACSRD